MGRHKKVSEQPIPEAPTYYTIIHYEELTDRDKDLLTTFFYKMKHIPAINEDGKIKEMLHYLDISGYSLCRKPKNK
jgi:hypothetical protein